MASMWQKTLFYLGLVDEDEAQPYESPARAVRRSSPTQDAAALCRPRVCRPTHRFPNPLRSAGWHRNPADASAQSLDSRGPPAPDPHGRRRQRAPGRTTADGPAQDADRSGTDRGRSHRARAATRRRCGPSPSRTSRPRSSWPAATPTRRRSPTTSGRRHPVVLDLRKVEPAMVRRLVDFASGLTYALGGSMRKIGQGVILVTPANVNITA